MKRIVLAVVFLVAQPGIFTRTAAAQPPDVDLGAIARELPALPRQADRLALPLAAEGTFAWHPIREGVRIEGQEGALTVSYQVVTGQPAGAALIVPPGTLSGLRSLRLTAHGRRNALLTVSLQNAAGVAYAFPALPVRVGSARAAEVSVDKMAYLPQQSKAPDPGTFDPAEAILITLIDIAGFMSAETPDVEWTIESFEGVAQ